MNSNNNTIQTAFDAEVWQTYYDLTQEPLLIIQSELCNEYVKVKAEYDSEPIKKKYLFGRQKQLERIIQAIDESYKAGRDYVGSMTDSFYIEFKRLEASKNREVDEMHQSYLLMAEIGIEGLERNIHSPLKKVA